MPKLLSRDDTFYGGDAKHTISVGAPLYTPLGRYTTFPVSQTLCLELGGREK